MKRRSFLKASAATPVALPLFSSLASSKAGAQTSSFPKRLLIFFQPNGRNPEDWFPTAGANERDFALNYTHAALEAHKADLLYTSGINMESLQPGPGEPHQRGMGAVLSGSHLQEGQFVGGDGSLAGWGDGESVDQHIANTIGRDNAFKSLEFGVRVIGAEVRTRINYAGPARPIPPQNIPLANFDRVFRTGNQNASQDEILASRRRSVLDAARQQFSIVRQKVSSADRQKLDYHLSLVRDLERRIGASQPAQCTSPDEPRYIRNATGEDNMQEVSRLQIDMMVAAFACDRTRVGTLQYSSGENTIRLPHVDNLSSVDHQLSHAGPTDAAGRAAWANRHRWYAGEFAYLLERLKSVPEGNGTLLDNTLIFWCSELAQGNTHSHANMPFVLAGGAGGAVETGRYVQYGGVSHNNLLVSIMNAMGVEGNVYGDPNYCQGALAGIVS